MLLLCPNPTCGKRARVPDDYKGRTIRCPRCRREFALAEALPVPPTEASAAPSRGPSDSASTFESPSLSRAAVGLGGIPPQIGRFQIRSLLGMGAFGSVYRAHDSQLDRDVALKVAHLGTASGQAKPIERFLREARAAAQLCHPHIVTVFDAGTSGDLYYIAATFIDGQTLAQAMDQAPLDDRHKARIVRDLAEALDYAHQLGIVHRDVKPANVMLDRRGEAHLMDFGLAHRQEGDERLTQDGIVLGTPAYMAPEQARGQTGEPLPASDQYSLGAMLYELLCGQTAFSGPPHIMLFNVMNTEPAPPHDVRPDVPPDLETICLKAMAKRPEDRYASCQELADDLRRWLEGEPIRARRVSRRERLARWCRREPRLALAGAGASLGLVAAALVPLIAAVVLSASVGQEEEAQRLAAESEETARASALQAEREKDRTAQATLAARTAVSDAEREATRAEDAVGLAETETQRAQQAVQQIAERERARRRYHYVADMNLAQQAFEDGKYDALNDLLKRYRPAGNEEDLRSFAWYHFANRAAAVTRAEGPARQPLALLRYTADGSALVTGRIEERTLRVDRYGPDGTPVAGGINLSAWSEDSNVFATEGLSLLSPDGRLILERKGSSSMKLWGPGRDQARTTLKEFPHSPSLVCWAPDGQALASFHPPRSLSVWRLASPNAPTGWDVDELACMTFSPNGEMLATAPRQAPAQEMEVTLWNVLTGKPARRLAAGKSPARGLAFSPDGQRLVGATATEVKLWDVASGKEQWTGATASERAPLFSPDGRTLATASHAPGGAALWQVRLWDVATGKERAVIPTKAAIVLSLAFSPDSQLLATSSDGPPGTMTLWHVATGRSQATYAVSAVGGVRVAFHPGGQWLATGGADGILKLWDRDFLDRTLIVGEHGAEVSALAFAPHTRTLTVAGETKVECWDLTTRGQRRSLADQASPVIATTYLADGQQGSTITKAGVFRAWQADGLKDQATIALLKGQGLEAAAIQANGKLVAGGLADGTVTVWETGRGEVVSSFTAHTGAVTALAFVPEGGLLISAGADRQIKLWDSRTGQGVATLENPGGTVQALALSADGKLLVTGCADHTARVWDVSTRKELALLRGHAGPVQAVAFSPDGRTIASGSADQTVKLWEPITGEELATLAGHTQAVTAVAFSADGTLLASGSKDGLVRVWQAPQR